MKNNIIMKCCVCERVKTDYGWNYNFVTVEEDVVSHGYCPLCYQDAMNELENTTAVQELALAR